MSDGVAGWRTHRFASGSSRGVVIETPDLRRHELTDDEARELVELIEEETDG